MATQDNVLRLLIAEDSLNDAEMLVSVLRNAGHPVRPTRIEDEDTLREALDGKTYDLFLYSLNFQDLPLAAASKLIQQSGKDIPVLAVTTEDDPERRREAMEQGAVDLVAKADLKHLQLVIRRELAHLTDRRRLRRMEASLHEVERRCHILLDNSRDAIAYVHEGMHIYANHAYLEKFGFASMADIEGMPLLDMAESSDQGKLKDFLRSYQKDAEGERELDLTMLTNDDGRPFAVTMTFSPASIEGEPCTQILMRDKGVPQALVQQLDTLSKQDMLSGLFNRQHFMEHLEQCVAKALDGGTTSGLLYIQLDGLEAARQAVGIAGVDTLIADMGAIIREEADNTAVAARFGDEVFTILLPDEGVHAAIALAEALRHKLEEHISETDGRTFTTTCSIGITMVAERTGNAQTALNEAIRGADQARAAGGNRVQLHTSEEEKQDAAAADWRQRMEDALAKDNFQLVYQPVASLQGDVRERYEVRLRLKSDEGLVMPEVFVPHAESTGIMPALDRWVVKHALQALAKRLAAGRDTLMFVKLSGPTVADAGFIAYLGEQLKASKVSGDHVVFQVNEPVAVTQLTQTKELLRGLKTLNCCFSLDHFGSGLNPFQLVKHLPADYLKVDAHLTSNLSDNKENQQAVKNLISSAHAIQKKVIAGYLEDASSLALLWQYGTDFVQGYFLQEPEPEMHYDFSGMVI